MAVRIRFQRVGKKKKPVYRLVVIESRKKRDGAVIEVIGHYQPERQLPKEKLQVKEERLAYWLGCGAQPSETARSLLRRAQIWSRLNTANKQSTTSA